MADEDDDAEGEDDGYSRSGGSDSESASEVETVLQTNSQNGLEEDVLQGAEIEIEGDFEYVDIFAPVILRN